MSTTFGWLFKKNEWLNEFYFFIVVSEVNEYKRLYEELYRLGSGAFGEVFVVKDKYDGLEYAVKKIRYGCNLIFRYI